MEGLSKGLENLGLRGAISVLDKLNLVCEKLNGEEAERFQNYGLGRYLTGNVTLVFGKQAYTLTFHKGTVIEVIKGTPLSGLQFGVAGPEEGWWELYGHKNFYRAIAPEKGKLSLQGNLLKAQGNLNSLDYLIRVLCSVV